MNRIARWLKIWSLFFILSLAYCATRQPREQSQPQFSFTNSLLGPQEELSDDLKDSISEKPWTLPPDFFNYIFNSFLCSVFCRTFSITSQTFRAMEESRSLRPEEMMPGRCTLMRLPKKLWMNLLCAMASNPYIRP